MDTFKIRIEEIQKKDLFKKERNDLRWGRLLLQGFMAPKNTFHPNNSFYRFLLKTNIYLNFFVYIQI